MSLLRDQGGFTLVNLRFFFTGGQGSRFYRIEAFQMKNLAQYQTFEVRSSTSFEAGEVLDVFWPFPNRSNNNLFTAYFRIVLRGYPATSFEVTFQLPMTGSAFILPLGIAVNGFGEGLLTSALQGTLIQMISPVKWASAPG